MSDYADSTLTLLVGDARERLRDLPEKSVQCVVTSPPYFGLRDYGVDGQIGLEGSLDDYIGALVDVFREVRRVLRDDGTVWLNLGDSYAGGGGYSPAAPSNQPDAVKSREKLGAAIQGRIGGGIKPQGVVKPKDLIGVPWRVAFALQADGWYLRSDVVWAKPNPMPESVKDRPTRSHEFVFLLTKSQRYYYDAEAVKEPSKSAWNSAKGFNQEGQRQRQGAPTATYGKDLIQTGRNRRDVWHIATRPFSGAHFAVFPPDLVEPCVLAGTSERGECAECGTPWVRQTEVVGHQVTDAMRYAGASADGSYNGTETKDYESAKAQQPSETKRRILEAMSRVVEHKWVRGCSCLALPVPQTVLDPFGGAGTTALVANKHGRNAVLIELNPDYAELTLSRLGREREELEQVA